MKSPSTLESDSPLPSEPESALGGEFRVMASRGLPISEIRELSTLSPWRSSLAVLSNFGLLAAAITVPLMWWHPVVILLAIPIIAGGQHGLFVLAHEAAHYRLFNTRWLNEAIGRSCGMMSGVSMCTYRVIHRLHHNHLYGPLDPDLPLIAGYPRGRAYLVKRLLRDLAGFTAHKNYAYFFGAPAMNTRIGENHRPLDDTSERLRQTARRDRWWVVGFHVMAPVLAIASGWVWASSEGFGWGGWAYFLLWVVPLVTVVQAILRFRALCEHGAVRATETPFGAARTTIAPGWVRWWLFPHHVNHHIEHHLYPAIPHYRLPACHRALKAAGLLEDAEVRNLWDTARSLFSPTNPAVALAWTQKA